MSAIPPVPMQQLCNDRFPRVCRCDLDGKRWLMATSGQAALLVAHDGKARVPRFEQPVAKALKTPPPSISVSWHDLQAWLRERAVLEPCPECRGIGTVKSRYECDFCDGAGSLEPVDCSFFGGAAVDRALVARFLAPVTAARVLVSPGSCTDIHSSTAMLLAAPDDSWRVYVMPLWQPYALAPWFPLGQQEAA